MSTYPEEFKALEQENERLKEELEDYHNTEKFVLSEDCPTDENHCGCVVILKKRIKDQNDQIRKLSHDLSCTDLY